MTASMVHPATTARPGRAVDRWLLVDVGVVALYLVCMAWEYLTPGLDDGYRHGSVALSVPLSVLAFAPIAIRRVRPVTALAISCGSIGLPMLLVPHWVLFWSGTLPTVLLLYTVARHRSFPVAAAGSLLPLAALAAMVVRAPQEDAVTDLAFLLTLEVVAVAAGVALQRSAARREELTRVLADLEHEQADRERLAVLAERRELARDLHDVVAHAVSLMLVQAGAARVALRDDPSLAKRFLHGVEEAGRGASGDLRHLLGVLRSEDAPVALEPSPGLTDVVALTDRMRAAGHTVRVEASGLPVLPAGLDVAAYRIVQEALTNVTKHAGPTEVDVRIEATDPLVLTVEDAGPTGPRPAAVSSGHGLVGMRERAALFGGTVEAGPSGRGFRVRAVLPMPPS